jgi:hypothetical protein
MRIRLKDHARFQRGAIAVIVASSALACAAALAGVQRLAPDVAVLAAAVAVLALALAEVELSRHPAADAARKAAAEVDPERRALLERAVAARATLGRAAATADDRALAAAADGALLAMAEACRRRNKLALGVRDAHAPDPKSELAELELRAAAAADPAARQAYERARAAVCARLEHGSAIAAVVDRIDARLAAAAAELEQAALAVVARTELAPGNSPQALASACDRLRTANAELGAECEALVEVSG